MKLQIALPLVVLAVVFSFLVLTAGCGDWGTGGGGSNPFLQIPLCPGSITATTSIVAGVYGVDLTWVASTTAGVTTYTVYYATPPTTSDVPSAYTSVSVGDLLSFTVSGLGT